MIKINEEKYLDSVKNVIRTFANIDGRFTLLDGEKHFINNNYINNQEIK